MGDLESFDRLAGRPVAERLAAAFAATCDPAAARMGLERWLVAAGNPKLYLQGLAESPDGVERLTRVLAASAPMADALVRNPEDGTVFFEPPRSLRAANRDGRLREARRVLGVATSYRHGLDRLRMLRTRWTLEILDADLSDREDQWRIWRELSHIAEVLIEASAEWAWRETGAPGELPVMIVGFGKLGGEELNYSSDVDLVYVLPDEADEATERPATKWARLFGHAMEDRMGRGSIARVDLRLRPYGAGGEIVRRLTPVDRYYDLYAEPWERLALLRSRRIAGPKLDWEKLRIHHVFERPISDHTLAEMIAIRSRLGEAADGDDLKRLPGGIRDIEFPVQILQIVHGRIQTLLRNQNTLWNVARLGSDGLLGEADLVKADLVFLRKLEHRLQMGGDRQTHAFPTDPAARDRLAALMDQPDGRSLAILLANVRERTAGRADDILADPRRSVPDVPEDVARAVRSWTFDHEVYATALRNPAARERASRIVRRAPLLGPLVGPRNHLLDAILSGEIEEAGRLERTSSLIRWVLAGGDLPADLTAAADRFLERYAPEEVEIVGLGSLGNGTMAPESDLDVLFVVPEGADPAVAEAAAEQAIKKHLWFRKSALGYGLDLRLRPDGNKGRLTVTHERFAHYELTDMELWERLMLGAARPIRASEETMRLVERAARGLPLTPERADELHRMKKRIETERVIPGHEDRDLKLGRGGISDLEWTVRLREWKRGVVHGGTLADRLAPDERADLGTLLDERAWLHLQTGGDLLPENPVKLDLLAAALGLENGERLLQRHRDRSDRVRALLDAAWREARA